jgi:hypothetical protein
MVDARLCLALRDIWVRRGRAAGIAAFWFF